MEVSFVMGVPPVIINFRLGFSIITQPFLGDPDGHGNPQIAANIGPMPRFGGGGHHSYS